MAKLKNNGLIRGLYFSVRRLRDYFVRRSKFAQVDDNVIITPPLYVGKYQNVYLGEGVCIGSNASISAFNAKFICKGHCAIAENLTVHTGNHASIVGTFVSDIRESNKPEGFDQNVSSRRMSGLAATSPCLPELRLAGEPRWLPVRLCRNRCLLIASVAVSRRGSSSSIGRLIRFLNTRRNSMKRRIDIQENN